MAGYVDGLLNYFLDILSMQILGYRRDYTAISRIRRGRQDNDIFVRKNFIILPQMYILLGIHYIAEYGVPSHHRGSCVIAGRLDS